MRKLILTIAAALSFALLSGASVPPMKIGDKTTVRPSASPLFTVDPYLSIWSFSDNLNESETVHWTGVASPLLGLVRVDGQVYRVLGKEEPRFNIALNTVAEGPWTAKCRMDSAPEGNWTAIDYDDSSWQEAEGAIGSKEMPGVKTIWAGNDRDVWVRRTFILDKSLENAKDAILEYSHDDVFELYINGTKVVDTGLNWKNNIREELPPEVLATLKEGKNVVAAHCHNTTGGSYVDFGIKERLPDRIKAVKARQKSMSVLPMRTVYSFACGPVDVDLVFTAPSFLDNLELLSRPVNYLTWQVKSNDGQEHDVQVYFTASPKQAVHSASQAVEAMEGRSDGIDFVRAGTKEQNILGRTGDDVRIDWGYVYVATPQGKGQVALSSYTKSLKHFEENGALPQGEGSLERDGTANAPIALAYSYDFGKVGSETVADYVMLGYDDIYSIQFFKQDLRPYWNRNGDKSITDQFAAAAAEYGDLMEKADAFDCKLMADARKAGGNEYAELCALAYRQAIAAHKLVQSPEGELMFFSKENFSNGSIGTVDITYPSSPMFLYYNTELAKALMNHIFHYSESGRWTKPFAAHDVGTYPKANGQTYGGDMPVEESGNMLILTAAISVIEGNAEYAAKHWDVLTTWTEYLAEKGLDPENQLCTDDFAGHFAHNANLSIKAIMGIASYAKMAGMLGKKKEAAKYMALAKDMASKWEAMAADGDHYKLTFDKPGTWSQKYNLVWDKLLRFNVFDPNIAKKEIAYYLTKQNTYGLPLDSRKTYTKTDWVLWTATMAQDRHDFEALVKPIWKFEDETTSRLPMSDWIFTDSPQNVGFRARSVVGGYYIKMLADRME